MARTKLLDINGATFELCGVSPYHICMTGKPVTIWDAYQRPSTAKVSIYNDWMDWARRSNAVLSVRGHAPCFFSLEGEVNFQGKRYVLDITYAHNRAYVVAD